MSKIALSGNASGTGTLTIAAPNTSTDRTLTLPDSSGTMATAESTLTQFNASGSAPVYACRAWVNFNGTLAAANMIRASGNVSSITDLGVGIYRVNFSTSMQDANYAISVVGGGGTGNSLYGWPYITAAPIAASCDVGFTNMGPGGATYTAIDPAICAVSIYR